MRTSLIILVLAAATRGSAAPTAKITGQFAGVSFSDTVALGSPGIPPDSAGGVSDRFILQAVNGGIAIFDRDGVRQGPIRTEETFIRDGGLAPSKAGYSDPRITFDPVSQRFFVVHIDLQDRSNNIYVSVSKTADPRDGFTSLRFPTTSTFGDFPTLGVNGDKVTIAVNTEGANCASVYTIPKRDLLLKTPTLNGLVRAENLDQQFGFALQPVNSSLSGRQSIIGTEIVQGGVIPVSSIEGSSASLLFSSSTPTTFDQFSLQPRQPQFVFPELDSGGNMISASTYQVGNFIFGVNTVGNAAGQSEVSTYDEAHYFVLNAMTDKLIAEGVIGNPAVDYTFASIAPSLTGNQFVIALNGSGPTQNLSAFAVTCSFDLISAVNCGNPLLVRAGLDAGFEQGNDFRNRFGDYSAIQRDPIDPSSYYLFQEVPGAKTSNFQSEYGTYITRLTLGDSVATVPEPVTWITLSLSFLLVGTIMRHRSTKLKTVHTSKIQVTDESKFCLISIPRV